MNVRGARAKPRSHTSSRLFFLDVLSRTSSGLEAVLGPIPQPSVARLWVWLLLRVMLGMALAKVSYLPLARLFFSVRSISISLLLLSVRVCRVPTLVSVSCQLARPRSISSPLSLSLSLSLPFLFLAIFVGMYFWFVPLCRMCASGGWAFMWACTKKSVHAPLTN